MFSLTVCTNPFEHFVIVLHDDWPDSKGFFDTAGASIVEKISCKSVIFF